MMPRLFVGARVSVTTASGLAGAAETLQRRAKDAGIDIRWVAPANYHVTLKFLGWTRDEMLPALRDGLSSVVVGISRFSFKTARLGAFPSLDKASVVWAGVESPDPLVEIAKRIEEISSPLGFPSEKRTFHAHVTLGRVRETRPVRDVVLPLAEQMFGETRVDSISLFESETKSSGSVYTELCKIPFRTASIAADGTPERQTRALNLSAPQSPVEPDLIEDTDDGWPRGHNPDR
jgi:RNA 2',3'-cyclic 3'-phosphodiesterase